MGPDPLEASSAAVAKPASSMDLLADEQMMLEHLLEQLANMVERD